MIDMLVSRRHPLNMRVSRAVASTLMLVLIGGATGATQASAAVPPTSCQPAGNFLYGDYNPDQGYIYEDGMSSELGVQGNVPDYASPALHFCSPNPVQAYAGHGQQYWNNVASMLNMYFTCSMQVYYNQGYTGPSVVLSSRSGGYNHVNFEKSYPQLWNNNRSQRINNCA